MYETKDKIVDAMVGAIKVLQHPLLLNTSDSKPHVPIYIDDMFTAVQEISGYSITMREVNFDAEHTHGRFERYKGNIAKIDVRAGLSVAEQRFVTAKELMHLIVDTREDYSPYGDQIIEELIDRGLLGKYNLASDISRPTASDVITEMAATEVLFPIQLRSAELSRVQRGETTYAKLATDYDVPNDCISRALNKSYIDACQEALNHVTS